MILVFSGDDTNTIAGVLVAIAVLVILVVMVIMVIKMIVTAVAILM